MEYKSVRFCGSLGSPLVSIAATSAARASGEPIFIQSEGHGSSKNVIHVGILG